MTAVSSLKNDLFRTNMKSCVTSLSFLQDLILDCHCQLYEQFRAQIPIWDMYIIYIYQFRQSQLFSGAPFTIFVAFWNRLLTSISLKILSRIKRKKKYIAGNGILLPKLFWPTVRKHCSSDREKLLRSLEQFIQTVKGQNNFW